MPASSAGSPSWANSSEKRWNEASMIGSSRPAGGGWKGRAVCRRRGPCPRNYSLPRWPQARRRVGRRSVGRCGTAGRPPAPAPAGARSSVPASAKPDRGRPSRRPSDGPPPRAGRRALPACSGGNRFPACRRPCGATAARHARRPRIRTSGWPRAAHGNAQPSADQPEALGAQVRHAQRAPRRLDSQATRWASSAASTSTTWRTSGHRPHG